MTDKDGRSDRAQCARSQILLRPYQHESIQELRNRIRSGKRRVLLVAPTGSGKTVIAAYIVVLAAKRGSRTLFIAHRRELINQACKRLQEAGLAAEDIGVIMAADPRRRPAAIVQVASVDTLRNRAKPKADIVFIDEAHRALARSYREISEFYPNAVHLGLTATPFRGDGRGLGDMYDDLIVVSSPRQLIEQGYLVEPRVFTVPHDKLPDLASVRVRRGDYDETQLAEAVDQKGLVGNIVDHWLRYASGVRTVAFAVSVEHSKHIAARFAEVGVPAEHLDGSTPKDDRDAALDRLDSGEILVVSNCSLFAEGWDQKSVKCAILARPTKSTTLYLQQAGRILRPWNNRRAIILDHVGCALEHGLPQDDRRYSLATNKEKDVIGIGEPPLQVCKQCYAIIHAALKICPECGCVLRDEFKVPRETDQRLIEVKSRTTPRPVRPLPMSYQTLTKTLRNAVRHRGGRLSWADFGQ